MFWPWVTIVRLTTYLTCAFGDPDYLYFRIRDYQLDRTLLAKGMGTRLRTLLPSKLHMHTNLWRGIAIASAVRSLV